MTGHLLSVHDLGAEGITELLALSDHMAEVNRRPIPKVPALRGKTVVSLFFEESTRTRLSFETAAKRLSADTMTFTAASSSVKKGESLRDTVETIQAMGIDALVVRHASAGVPWQVARWVGSHVSVINGGDGAHEHPTQALLDCATVRAALPGRPFDSLRVAIVGDVAHSRVARSTTAALTALGAQVTLVGPGTLLPVSIEGWAAKGGTLDVSHDLDGLLGELDVCYLLRMQLERQGTAANVVPTLREYTAGYGLTSSRAARLPDHAIVMHPGPMNRGVEIAAEVADSPRAVITQQVANGVAVRMAVLYWLLGSGTALGASDA
jgi:aspartate carbamoyltransferase catalytic subunit